MVASKPTFIKIITFQLDSNRRLLLCQEGIKKVKRKNKQHFTAIYRKESSEKVSRQVNLSLQSGNATDIK